MTNPRRSPLYGESGHRRRPHEDYRTHPAYTAALARYLDGRLVNGLWECACGAGDISRTLECYGYRVTSTDKRAGADRLYGRGGVDFLACRKMRAGTKGIFTNPPYAGDDGDVVTFLKHALALTEPVGGQVVLFLRLEWVATLTASGFINERPFAGLYPVFPRPRWDWCDGMRLADADGPRHPFAWYFWDWCHRGSNEVGHLQAPGAPR